MAIVRIAVCDDEAQERLKLIAWLREYYDGRGICFHINEYSSGEELMADYEDGAASDLIFLDIYMDGADGVETAAGVRRFDTDAVIVFLTTSPDHAIEGYSVSADGYILKPADDAALTRLMSRLEDKLRLSEERSLFIGNASHSVKLPFKDIVYAESRDKNVDVYMADGTKHRAYERFGDVEPRLAAPCFLRCNRGVVINMDHVLDAGDNFTMSGGARIPIKVRERKRIRDQYYAYMMLTRMKDKEGR